MHIDYVSVSLLDLIQHLYTNYGVITSIDLEENGRRMCEPYDATKHIETLFE